DLVLEFDGRTVTEMRRLPRMVAETPVGRTEEVVVWRRSERQQLKVDLVLLVETVDDAWRQPEVIPSGEQRIEELGLTLSEISSELQQRFPIDRDAVGVVVTEVEEDSDAAERGLRPGDQIVEFDQEPVTLPDEVRHHLEKAREEGYRVVT